MQIFPILSVSLIMTICTSCCSEDHDCSTNDLQMNTIATGKLVKIENDAMWDDYDDGIGIVYNKVLFQLLPGEVGQTSCHELAIYDDANHPRFSCDQIGRIFSFINPPVLNKEDDCVFSDTLILLETPCQTNPTVNKR